MIGQCFLIKLVILKKNNDKKQEYIIVDEKRINIPNILISIIEKISNY